MGQVIKYIHVQSKALVAKMFLVFVPLSLSCSNKEQYERPNIIIFLTDDMGYFDLGSFGNKNISTPNIDWLAENGMILTDFYVSNSLCMPSRAALLTGTYPARNLTKNGLPDELPGALHKVRGLDTTVLDTENKWWIKKLIATDPAAQMIFQRDALHPNEVTIAEILKQRNYNTAMFGKWHLGYFPEYWPTNQGFDYFYGIPYSHDMYPGNNNPWAIENHAYFPNLPLIINDSIIEYNPDFEGLTQQYTRYAMEYINKNTSEAPFFIYMAYNLPHVPLAVSREFKDTTGAGLYADVLKEIDWSVGQIIQLLQNRNIFENTLIIFTSDNGPWLNYGDHAGSAYPLREGKGTVFEGGVRVPTIIHWPGVVEPGTTNNTPLMTIDVLPTIAKIVDTELPEHEIDGSSFLPLLKGHAFREGEDKAYLFYGGGNDIEEREVLAIRKGNWKLVYPHHYRTLGEADPGKGGQAVTYENAFTDTALFNLLEDVEERVNVKRKYPEKIKELINIADRMDQHIKMNARPAGYSFKKLTKN